MLMLRIKLTVFIIENFNFYTLLCWLANEEARCFIYFVIG